MSPSRISALAAVLVLLIVSVASSFAQSDTMLQNLARMRNRWEQNPKDLESVYVYMTSAAQDPLEKGVVYQNIVSMFALKGTKTYADDIAKYSEKVMELPYKSSDLAQMYLDCGDGLIADAPKGADGTAELKESDRTDVAKWYLRAMKILLDTISFDEADAADNPGATEAEIKTQHDRNAMVAKRNACLTYLKELYGTEPAELAKLSDLASHELGEKARGEMLLKALRGEKVGDAPSPQTGLAQSASAASQAPSAPESGSGNLIAFLAVIAVAGISGLVWFMKKKAI